MNNTIISKLDDVKKEFKDYFDNQFKVDLKYYGPGFGDLITGTLWESIVNLVFKNVYGLAYDSYTDQNLCYDGKVGDETISFKGSYAKYAKTLKKHSLSITQYRTTKFINIEDKINFINDSIKNTNYELVCIRIDKNNEYQFKVILFEKKIFSVPDNKLFRKKHETKNRQSKQRYFKCELNKNITLTISGSASDQLMVQINNLDDFIKQSSAIILYDSFN